MCQFPSVYFSCSVVRTVVSRAHWRLDPMLRVPPHVAVEKVDRLLWSCMRKKESKKRGNAKQRVRNAFSLKMLFSWKIFALQSEPNGTPAFALLWATQPRTYELIYSINVQRHVSMKNLRDQIIMDYFSLVLVSHLVLVILITLSYLHDYSCTAPC